MSDIVSKIASYLYWRSESQSQNVMKGGYDISDSFIDGQSDSCIYFSQEISSPFYSTTKNIWTLGMLFFSLSSFSI